MTRTFSELGSNRPCDYRFGELERLEAICVERAVNGNAPYASGGTVSVPTRRWSLVVSARVVQPVAVRTDACIVVFERNFQRFRSNAVYSTSQSGCKRSIRRCTGGAFALCRKHPGEQWSVRADWIGWAESEWRVTWPTPGDGCRTASAVSFTHTILGSCNNGPIDEQTRPHQAEASASRSGMAAIDWVESGGHGRPIK